MSTLTASHGLTLSKTGLKLIKAYEGFRPVDRILVSGQRVVGYGHRLYDDKPRQITKAEAEELLISDLRPYEDMINENVFAPLTQGQFDALVSFSFNIGPKAFLASETLHALNNGRPLEAANALDVWRKSTINGKTYIVDALMRRRTAEKALFLRTEHYLRSAPGIDLPPVRDEALAKLSTDEDLPVFDRKETSGIVATAPFTEDEIKQADFASEDYALKQSEFALNAQEQDIENEQEPDLVLEQELETNTIQNRRRDDGPAGVLMLSEVAESPFIAGPEVEDALLANDVSDETVQLTLPDEKVDVIVSDKLENQLLSEEEAPSAIEESVEVTKALEASETKTIDELSANRSVIAEAAADISERLDALIEDAKGNKSDMDWPEESDSDTRIENTEENFISEAAPNSNFNTQVEEVLELSKDDLVEESSSNGKREDVSDSVNISGPVQSTIEDRVADTKSVAEDKPAEALLAKDASENDLPLVSEEEAPRLTPELESKKADIIIDNLAEDDAMRIKDDEMSIFYERHNPAKPSDAENNLGFWLIMLSGFILLGITLAISLRGAESLMGAWGPLVVISGVLIGALMVIGAAYYAIRHALSYN